MEQKMEENMSENFDELGELGDKIKKIIDTAVSTKDQIGRAHV